MTGRVMIEVEAASAAATIFVRGELDLVTMPLLTEQLTLVAREKPGQLVFDLARTDFMDCGSARLIVGAGEWLPEGQRPVIRRPSRAVRRILELTGLEAYCAIEGLVVGSTRTCAVRGSRGRCGSGSMSVSIQDVRQALNELGKLRFGEMRVEDAMNHIVQTTHTIFSVDGAGLMLADVDHHLMNAAVSDDRMRHLEELQIRHQEGPCIAAFEDKELIRAEDLSQEDRWPAFASTRSPAESGPFWPVPSPITRTRWVLWQCCRKIAAPGRPRPNSGCSRSLIWPRCSSPACCSANGRPSWPPSCNRR